MFLSIIIPCYNEEPVIQETNRRVSKLLGSWITQNLITKYEIIYINDGSTDATFSILKNLTSEDSDIKMVSFSNNFGHQAALTAGFNYAKGDAIVSLDADLQDPPEIIELMLEKFNKGFEIIYGVRESRQKDTLFKRITARSFYRLTKLMGVNIIADHADFRLISRRVAAELKSYGEVNRFLRGIFPLMGFNQCIVKYERQKRFAGKTKYPLRKMVAFAIEGITSFTYLPIRLSAFLGSLLFIISLAMSLWALIIKIFGYTVPGWTSTVIPVYMFSGVQLMFLGIIGEYIGKIYMEIKKRPIFIVKETFNIDI